MKMFRICDRQLNADVTRYQELGIDEAVSCAKLEKTHAVFFPNDGDVQTLRSMLPLIGAVILHFPAFTDGRAYTQARSLRQRLDFSGHIIARGDVLPDQVLFMARCGIDAIETDVEHVGVFNDALRAFTHFYQHAADGTNPVWMLRHKTVGRPAQSAAA